MDQPFVVIGGDAAGMSAASKARRAAPELDIVVFEKGDWVSYAACGMPYYIKGDVPALEDLVQITPEQFRTERDIDVRLHHEVTAIDPAAKTVTVAADGDTFEQRYGQLLIATGAHAVEPPFEGLDREGVFTVHRMDDAAALDEFIETTAPDTAAIVGGGYVGIEMAEALAARDLDIHLFEMLPHVLDPFGEAVATVVEDHLEAVGVDLHLDTAVAGFQGDDRVTGVELDDGATVDADLVIVGVGAAPNVALASAAGIDVGPTGAIATDEYGRTSASDVFAAGDCAEATNVVTGAPDHVPLALTANRAGRAIGQTVTGTPTAVGEIAGTAIVKAFEVGAARTGVLDDDVAREAGFDPVRVEITAPTRAHYYPGAEELTVTLVADRDSGRVLGASLVGRDGVKRVDTVATALHAGLSVTELQNLDLAYAPPFSPVWDPVATAAKVLAGKL